MSDLDYNYTSSARVQVTVNNITTHTWHTRKSLRAGMKWCMNRFIMLAGLYIKAVLTGVDWIDP
jgi:hypothetical protein